LLVPSISVDGAIRPKPGINPLGDRPWPMMILNTLPFADIPLPQFLKRKVLQRTLIIAGMGNDESGSVRLKNNRLEINYDPSNSVIYDDIRDAAKIVADELGGSLSGGDKPTTAHPMGGASIGADELHGVIDSSGQVFGHPGLYVCDGAALPAPVGGPPSLTIGAWADFVADSFIQRFAQS